jgi:hypothetical protein
MALRYPCEEAAAAERRLGCARLKGGAWSLELLGVLCAVRRAAAKLPQLTQPPELHCTGYNTPPAGAAQQAPKPTAPRPCYESCVRTEANCPNSENSASAEFQPVASGQPRNRSAAAGIAGPD